jgi:hypothetical protein
MDVMTDVNVMSAAADVADVIAVPRQEAADSFVLHAPLELLARTAITSATSAAALITFTSVITSMGGHGRTSS